MDPVAKLATRYLAADYEVSRGERWVMVRTNQGWKPGRLVMHEAYTSKIHLRVALRNPGGRTRIIKRLRADVQRINLRDKLAWRAAVVASAEFEFAARGHATASPTGV